MRSILILVTILSLLFGKDINHKVHSIEKDETSSSFTRVENDSQINELRTSRDDTTTIWFEDFEGEYIRMALRLSMGINRDRI